LEKDIESHKEESSEIIFGKNQMIVSLKAEEKVLHENVAELKEVQREYKDLCDGLDQVVRDVNMNIGMENEKNGTAEELSIQLSKRCEEENLKAISLKDHDASTQKLNKDVEETVQLSKVQQQCSWRPKDDERVSKKNVDEVNLDAKMLFSADCGEKILREENTSIPKISFRKDIFKIESSAVPNTFKDVERQLSIPIITTERRNEKFTNSKKRKYAN